MDLARRYEAANGLAGDIQRYLADEVVRWSRLDRRAWATVPRYQPEALADTGRRFGW
jgi:hypothetical protein